MKKKIDFVVIGAQKSGTTSLFRYLKGHPRIYLPLGKEVPYFNQPQPNEDAWQNLLENNFRDAPDDALWGKVTPQYMVIGGVAERLKAHNDAIKIIAILRNPIDRMVSSYKMSRRRGLDAADAATSIKSQFERLSVLSDAELNAMEAEHQDSYVLWSQYGRILEAYFATFERENILVLFFEDLEADAAGTIDNILEFLGLPAGYRPENLGKVYLKGGMRQKSKILAWVMRSLPARYVLRMLPEARRRQIWFWQEEFNTAPGNEDEAGLNSADRAIVAEYLRNDVHKLQAMIGREAPWSDFRERRPTGIDDTGR